MKRKGEKEIMSDGERLPFGTLPRCTTAFVLARWGLLAFNG